MPQNEAKAGGEPFAALYDAIIGAGPNAKRWHSQSSPCAFQIINRATGQTKRCRRIATSQWNIIREETA